MPRKFGQNLLTTSSPKPHLTLFGNLYIAVLHQYYKHTFEKQNHIVNLINHTLVSILSEIEVEHICYP